MVSFLSKPTLLFLSFNLLRVLSVVGLCLVFASEIVTINSDVKGMRAEQKRNATSSTLTATPSTTASINILRRDLRGQSLETPASAMVATSIALAPASSILSTALPTRLVRVHKTAPHHHLAARLERREPQASESAQQRLSSRSTSTSSSTSSSIPGATATNAPLSHGTGALNDESQTCAYIGQTSIPKGTAGALFSTLERIFASFLLLLMLFSELAPPFPPLSRPARWLHRFWSSFFPPFSDEYGVGVLGAVEVFVSCQVLSHATSGWIQVSSWFLFIVGILNMLAGLAFGARLKIVRSLSKDSTTPSALRQLRLNGASASDEKQFAPSHQYTEFGANDPTPAIIAAARATPDSKPKRRSVLDLLQSPFNNLLPTSNADDGSGGGGDKKSTSHRKTKTKGGTTSRNGPNGIVISAPIRPPSELHGGGGAGVATRFGGMSAAGSTVVGPAPPPPIYHRGDE